MTGKSKKGIVGKSIPRESERYQVCPGIDFLNETLKNGNDIENAVKRSKKEN